MIYTERNGKGWQLDWIPFLDRIKSIPRLKRICMHYHPFLIAEIFSKKMIEGKKSLEAYYSFFDALTTKFELIIIKA